MLLRSIASLACTVLLSAATLTPAVAQNAQPKPSPPATATVSLNGRDVTINYSAPSMRGRKIMGGLVPFDKVWRTGANEATTFVNQGDLKIGPAKVPAGSYTLYTLPDSTRWLLIINKQTGQWGTVYDQSKDLVRIPMHSKTLSTPQEKMSITFENTVGNITELHIRWENTDQYIEIVGQ
ncbi:MAG TPA: DUF2911 domain-containing protein [Edaphobacter sp.]|jgi:hypothetical protein|nr:DUF2911 domain-containing protein [Edaphobacter sp.]